MNNSSAHRMMTIKMPDDAREILARWAEKNVSSLNAEIVRSIRDRAEREKAAAAQ